MSRKWRASWVLVLVALVPAWSWAQRKSPAKRVKPQEFSEQEVKQTFFDDVFAILVGQRPPSLTGAAPAPVRPAGAEAAPEPGSGNAGSGWAALISGDSIENEIKTIKLAMDRDVTTPGEFKGRGYKVCRRNLTVAAMLFGIISEYDGEVRWQQNASGFRDVLARTAKNCKVGTTQVYNEAKLRKQDLQDVVGGSAFQGKEGDPELSWERICDRSPLMQRLEVAQQERLQPMTSNQAEFKKNKDKVVAEAELIAAIATVLMKESMEDAGDEDYDGFSRQMRDASREIVEGAALDNYEKVKAAVGKIGQSCAACHENYRA